MERGTLQRKLSEGAELGPQATCGGAVGELGRHEAPVLDPNGCSSVEPALDLSVPALSGPDSEATLLRVLVVEDNPLDAELMVAQLARAGFDSEWECVDTEQSFTARLKRGGLDLVLSDYSLPRFSGLRALEILRQSGLDVPLIIVSGTIGEETAVAAMKLGAADYLLKDRLGRLGPAVTHALDQSRLERERKDAETALRISEMRFHGTLDSMLEGCQIISFEWRYLYLNDTAATHGGRRKEELIGRTMLEVYPGIEHSEVFSVLRRCMNQREGARIENEFNRGSGPPGWFELSVQPVPEGIFVLSLDITDRRQAALKHREQLDELIRWQEITLDREDRVQALKAEVNELLAQLHQPPRYTQAGQS